MTLLSGAARYLELGESLSDIQQASLTAHASNAQYHFAGDGMLQAAAQRLENLL